MLSKLLKKPLLKRWGKIALLTGLFFIAFFFINQRYRIKQIEIQLNERGTIFGLDDYKNQLSFLLNEKNIFIQLEKKNPNLKITLVQVKYPDKLFVRAKNNQGIALLKTNQGYFTLGDTGTVIKKDKNLSLALPLINYYQQLDYLSYNPGEKIDFSDLIFCLNLTEAIQNLGFQINSIDIQGATMIVLNLSNHKKIIVNQEKNVPELKEELGIIVKQIRIRGTDFSQLDLRFNKPVIIF